LGVASPISGSLSDRFGTRRIAVIGLAALLLTYVLLTTLSAETDAIGFILRFAPLGIGMGIFQSPNNSAVMGTAPRERLGVVSGLLAITRTVGQTTGIAVLGAVWAGRVLIYTGGPLPGGATSAPIEAQVVALHEAYLVMAALVAVGLGLGLWALAEERRAKVAAALAVEPSTQEGA